MLREVVESEHHVFVFKLVVFLLVTVEKGGRGNVLRFVRSGGANVIVPLIVLSLAKVCFSTLTLHVICYCLQDHCQITRACIYLFMDKVMLLTVFVVRTLWLESRG